MNQVQALLVEGQGAAARQRLGAIIAQDPGSADAMAEMAANMLWSCYEQFHVQAVHDFCRDLETGLPAPVAACIQRSLGPRIQRTAEWSAILRGVTRERLVRECRDHIINKELKKAALAAATLLERARDASELDDSSLLLARGMATLQRDRDLAIQVVGYLMKAGNQTRMAAPVVADQFTSMSREFKSISFENTSQEWTHQLTDALLSFRAFLPGPMEAGEPEPGQVEKFYEEAHACLRAGLHYRNREDFIDALAVLMEYCPTDPPAIKNAAGVEGRMFLNLGPRAKLVAVRSLVKLGELDLLRKTVAALAREAGPERLKLLGAIMGGLRSPDFFPYLYEMLRKADNRRDEALAIEGLGRIGSDKAAALLLDLFEGALKKSSDPVQEHRAYLLLTALGRIGRTRGLDPKRRAELVKRVVKLTDRSDRKLAFHAAGELFSVRLDELEADQKNWAAQKAVDAMWGQPLREPDTPSVYGWREPMVNTLRRLGSGVLPAVLEAGARHAAQYSGAMGALAGALEEIGDERAVSLLDTMLRTAFLYEDDPYHSRLTEEKVIDAATGQSRLLSRDEVIHALLYTIKQIGGGEGLKVILGYADQVQGGRLESPGQQTVNLLVDVKLRQGQLELQRAQELAAEVDEKAFRQALAAAKGGLLTRKSTQIAAIAQLGQMRRVEGVGVLVDALGDKDPMVASAAHTALAQFMVPLPAEQPFNTFLEAFFERPAALKGRATDRVMDFINRELPKKAPYDRLLDRQVEIMIEDGELAHRLRAAMHQPRQKVAQDPVERLKNEKLREEVPANGADPSVFIDDDRLARQSDLDKKRAYFQAHRDWVRGGKVGDPPKPPH